MNKHLKSCVPCAKSLQSCLIQAPPLSLGFSRQEYWSGLPLFPPGDLPDSGIEPVSLMFSELANGFFTTSATREVPQKL